MQRQEQSLEILDQYEREKKEKKVNAKNSKAVWTWWQHPVKVNMGILFLSV